MQIISGFGKTELLTENLSGHKTLIVCSRRGRSALQAKLPELANFSKEIIWLDSSEAYQQLERLESTITSSRGQQFSQIVAFGGGATIDMAKVVLGLAKTSSSDINVRDLIREPDVISPEIKIPFIAVPTTFGSGSEVTGTATIWDFKRHKKLSLESDLVIPTLAIVDPNNGATMPIGVAWDSALDALVHLLDSLWNKNATPDSLARCVTNIPLAVQALKAFTGRVDSEYLDLMAMVSLEAGLCIRETRTSICHALSYPLTLKFGISHGTAVAFSVAAVARYAISSDSDSFSQMDPALIDSLPQDLEIISGRAGVRRRVREKVFNPDDILQCAEGLTHSGRAGNFSIPATDGDLQRILEESFLGS